jgi:PAS domain S-box-containing protein
MTKMNNPEYFSYLLNCSSFAIISTDCDGNIITWNRAAYEIFQKSADEMIGRQVEEIVPENRRSLLNRALQRAQQDRRTAELEIDHPIAPNKIITLALVITPVIDDKDVVVGLSAWIRNITHRKNLERQLLHAERMASLGTLASGVAHHFNNIIGGVATFVDYALTSNNPQASHRALEMTAEAATRVGEITESLLTFAEKDSRSFDLADLTEVILTFSHLVENPLAQKNIKLEMHLEAIPLFEIPGSRMHQVLGNLLDNAERALPEGGTVSIKLRAQEGELILHFSDTGCGIAPQDIKHIFEPFFTTFGTLAGGNHTSRGLGLSVVHGVVHEMGGTIDVSSKLNQGTEFVLRFPLDRKKTDPTTENPQPEPPD